MREGAIGRLWCGVQSARGCALGAACYFFPHARLSHLSLHPSSRQQPRRPRLPSPPSAASSSSSSSWSSRFDPRPAVARLRSSAADGAALLAAAHSALKASAGPLILAFAAADALTFLIHRAGHRATNALALALLPGVRAAVDGAAAGNGGGGILNPWWLTNDPAIANFATGYQWLVLLLFLAVFPLNVGVRAAATSAAAFLTDKVKGGKGAAAAPSLPAGEGGKKEKTPGVRARLASTLAALRGVAPDVRSAFARVLAVDLAVAVRAVPLQAACLAILPLPWALPRLLDLQTAGAVAALEGAPGDLALERAARLTAGRRGSLAWPYIGLLVAGRLLNAVRAATLAALPPRIVAGVPELALALWALGLAASVWVARLGDVLPIVARERWAAAEGEVGGDGSSAAGA
jgi:hypothetical protein